MDKKNLKWRIDNGRITIWMKCPDHQPPHVHAFLSEKEEDVIIIQTQERDAGKNLKNKDLRTCEKWIKENKKMLLDKWAELETMGLIPKPIPILKKKIV